MTAPKPFPDVWAKACMSDVQQSDETMVDGYVSRGTRRLQFREQQCCLLAFFFLYIYELMMLYLVLFPMAVHYGFVDDDFC